jgi:4-hydroxybenzoate polyprenyltransferase
VQTANVPEKLPENAGAPLQASTLKRFRILDILILSWVPLPFLKHATSAQQAIVFVATILAYNYFMFSFNDYMDRNQDYHDLEKRARNPFLNERYKKIAITLMVSSGVLLVLIGCYHLRSIYINVLLFLIAFNYSAGLRAKNKPFLDVVVHGFWILGMVVYGIHFFDVPVSFREIAFLYEYFILSTALELSQGLRDHTVDAATNEMTTVVKIGPKATKIVYAALIVAFAVVTPLLVESIYLRFLPLLFLPMFFFTKQETFDQRANIINLASVYAAVAYIL